MHRIQHVLFPVDFSPRCEGAVPYVKEMVRSCNAKLTLLHVVEIPLKWYGNMWPTKEGLWDSLEENLRIGQQNIGNFGCTHFNDLSTLTPVRAICDHGDPGYAILAHAEKIEADLIMMPTRGESPFRSFLIGSATARVLHRAACPVWTGAHLENDTPNSQARIRKILCAVDLARESAQLIGSTVALARTFSAQVRLVHSVAVPETGPTQDFASAFDRFLADAARQELQRIQEQAGTDFEVYLEGGSIASVVRDEATRYGADLVVIGRGHVQSPFSRLRSNAYAIVRDSRCPVLSI